MNNMSLSNTENAGPDPKNDPPSCPLVSIVVITYNSSQFVLDTLESIKNQTYQNIELIISDDCSTDNTASVVAQWLANNSNRFMHHELVVAGKNKGIPGNCNLGLSKVNGEWIKYIAGDDILLPDCISIFYAATLKNENVGCFVSDVYVMQNNIVDIIYSILEKRLPANSQKQLDNFLFYGSLPGPALFFRKNILIDVGGFNERYRGVEDYPMYIALSSRGYFFTAINKPTVIYRVHQQSISRSTETIFEQSMRLHFNDVVRPLLIKRRLYCLYWHHFLSNKLANASGKSRLSYSVLTRMTDLIYWRKKWMLLNGYDIHSQIKSRRIPPFLATDAC